MSTTGSSSLSTSLNSIKKNSVNNYGHNQNKLYTKEINNLINKIIKSKNSAFHFSKINQNSQGGTGPYDNQNYSSNEARRSNVKISNNSKKNTKNNLSKSNNSSLNEASSISLVCNNNINLKMIEFSKSMNYFILKKNDINITKQEIIKRSLLINDLLHFIKTEKNLSNIINEQDQFISDFIEFMTLINFAHIKYYPIYKITDNNYNLIESTLNKSTIEEFVSTENNNDNAAGPSMIRIKKDNWQDILNLYDIFIELLNNLPTSSIIISR